MIRVLIADDHPVVLEGLEVLLKMKGEGIEVAGAATDGADALQLATETQPDVLLLDVRIPDIDGVEVVTALKRTSSGTRVIMLTFLPYTDARVIRSPTTWPVAEDWRDNRLYDIERDYAQTNDLCGTEPEKRYIDAIVRALEAADAPPEQYQRLGLNRNG